MALAIPTKLEEPLVRAFDSMVAAGLYQSRSEAIRDAARRLVERSYMSRSDFLRTMAEICGQFILREYEDLVTDLILYGSAAKGQASEDDDLDILVLISKDRTGPSEVEIRVHEITYPVALASASVITPIVLEKKRFLDLLRAGQHFPGEIVRHGI